MSKPVKILVIVSIVLIVVLGAVLTLIYIKSVSVNKKETTSVVTEKDENTKELESINTEIQNSEDLDLTDINQVSNELGQIDVSGL